MVENITRKSLIEKVKVEHDKLGDEPDLWDILGFLDAVSPLVKSASGKEGALSSIKPLVTPIYNGYLDRMGRINQGNDYPNLGALLDGVEATDSVAQDDSVSNGDLDGNQDDLSDSNLFPYQHYVAEYTLYCPNIEWMRELVKHKLLNEYEGSFLEDEVEDYITLIQEKGFVPYSESLEQMLAKEYEIKADVVHEALSDYPFDIDFMDNSNLKVYEMDDVIAYVVAYDVAKELNIEIQEAKNIFISDEVPTSRQARLELITEFNQAEDTHACLLDMAGAIARGEYDSTTYQKFQEMYKSVSLNQSGSGFLRSRFGVAVVAASMELGVEKETITSAVMYPSSAGENGKKALKIIAEKLVQEEPLHEDVYTKARYF